MATKKPLTKKAVREINDAVLSTEVPDTGARYRCGLSGCIKTFDTLQGLRVHRSIKHKKRAASTAPFVTIEEAGREHLDKSHKLDFFTCASRPCTFFPRQARRDRCQQAQSLRAPLPPI